MTLSVEDSTYAGQIVRDSDPRFCLRCEEPITAKRLEAVPKATHCVPCLVAMGDVPHLKRFDQTVKDGEVQELFTEGNPYMELAVTRLTSMRGATDEAFDMASGEYILEQESDRITLEDEIAALEEPISTFVTTDGLAPKVRIQ